MKNRILSNTLYLYSRQIIIILVTLYSMRVVLIELGIEDFGIYGVVTGFITLLAFLPGSMSSVTQRFFSFAIGEKDVYKLKKIFSINLIIYFFIALLAFLILNTLGKWYINEHLNLPDSRIQAAISLYSYSSLAFVISIFTAPFIAILIAHEDMHFYALLSVGDAILKLIIVISMAYVSYDALIYYGMMLCIASFILSVIYITFCIKKYKECQLKKIYWDQSVFKEILNFTWWTLFGQISTAFRNQAVTVLVNQMFNPGTVAARIIALNVANQIAIFSTNLNTSLYPPIVKYYAAGQIKEMIGLVFNGSKLTFFLMWIFALPLIIKMEYILEIWLVNTPVEAVIFSQLAIVEGLILALALPITSAARAFGKMALYEISLGTIQILIFFISYRLLTLGYNANWVFYIAIFASFLMFIVRLLLVKYLINLPILSYVVKVFFPVFMVVVFTLLFSIILDKILVVEGFIMISLYMLSSLLFSVGFIYFFGLDAEWRNLINKVCIKKLGGRG